MRSFGQCHVFFFFFFAPMNRNQSQLTSPAFIFSVLSTLYFERYDFPEYRRQLNYIIFQFILDKQKHFQMYATEEKVNAAARRSIYRFVVAIQIARRAPSIKYSRGCYHVTTPDVTGETRSWPILVHFHSLTAINCTVIFQPIRWGGGGGRKNQRQNQKIYDRNSSRVSGNSSRRSFAALLPS